MKDEIENIKVLFSPPWMFNPIEFKYSEDGSEIIGWRPLGWKNPEEYERYKHE